MTAKRIQDIPGLRKVDEGVYARVVGGKLQIWEDATPDNIRLEPSIDDVMDEGDPVRISPSRTITVRGGNVEFTDMVDDGKRLHREAEEIKTKARGPSDVTTLVNTLAAAKEQPKGDIYAEMRAFKEQVDRVKDERRGVYGTKSEPQAAVAPVLRDATPAEVKAVRKLAREMVEEKESPKKAPVQTLADIIGEDKPERTFEDDAFGLSADDKSEPTLPLWMMIALVLGAFGGICAIGHVVIWAMVRLNFMVPLLTDWGLTCVKFVMV